MIKDNGTLKDLRVIRGNLGLGKSSSIDCLHVNSGTDNTIIL